MVLQTRRGSLIQDRFPDLVAAAEERSLTACERYLHPNHHRVGGIRALLVRMASA
ncbi:hypothetical protein ACH4U5_01240 [Streptomyces sp. NPDC020858]|uniref:hypothetical protein n=1 Tax=Streptomyces sp. NPDC020858 TaxID=3365097 RepID=UPI003787B226